MPVSCWLTARPGVGDELVRAMLKADQSSEAVFSAQRERVALLKQRLHELCRYDDTQEWHERLSRSR